MKMTRRGIFFSLVGVVIVLTAIGLIIFFGTRGQQPSVASFQECVDKGYPVTGINPRKCTAPNGVVYSEPQTENNNGTTSNGNTQQPATNPPVQNNDRQTLTLAVYFSKDPESLNDFTYTQAVTRSSNRADMGTYTIEQLIAGPTSAETSMGLFSPLKGKLQGDSNCSGKDFSLTVSDRTARLKFCRAVASAGIGDDARITSTVSRTLRQFSSVDTVVILTRDGNCFDDQSGENHCLQ